MKRIMTLVMALIITVFSVMPAMAATSENNSVLISGSGDVITRAEETKWYYRDVNGYLEMRLWSITYGYWKTDWMSAM